MVNTRLPAEERRAQLVHAALTLAEAEGFGSVTIRRVADEAGVSLGVVHYCFESKEELMAAAISNIVAMLGEAMAEAYAPDEGAEQVPQGREGLREYLRRGVENMWGLIEATPNVQLLTYEITTYALRRGAGQEGSDRDAAAHALAARQYIVTDSVAVEFLEEAARASGVQWARPVEYVARVSLTFIDGLVLRWLVDRESETARLQLGDFTDFVVELADAD
ncbi:TetR/AcrR family transcriptional regulator [Tomitella fengzijianii]|nr:TetR family transcriptional regulator [Tomitella fengzijianii]